MADHAQLTRLLNGLALGEHNGRKIAEIILGPVPTPPAPDPVPVPTPTNGDDDQC